MYFTKEKYNNGLLKMQSSHLRDDGVGDASVLVQKVLLGFHFTTSVTCYSITLLYVILYVIYLIQSCSHNFELDRRGKEWSLVIYHCSQWTVKW